MNVRGNSTRYLPKPRLFPASRRCWKKKKAWTTTRTTTVIDRHWMIRPFESQEIFDEANDEIEDPLLANENTHHSGERKNKNLRFVREITERGGEGRERRKGRERNRAREMARGRKRSRVATAMAYAYGREKKRCGRRGKKGDWSMLALWFLRPAPSDHASSVYSSHGWWNKKRKRN